MKLLSIGKAGVVLIIVVLSATAFFQYLTPTVKTSSFPTQGVRSTITVGRWLAKDLTGEVLPHAMYQDAVTPENLVRYLEVGFTLTLEGSAATESPIAVSAVLYQDGGAVAWWKESAELDANYWWEGGTTLPRVELPKTWGEEGAVSIPYSLVVRLEYSTIAGESYSDEHETSFSVSVIVDSGRIRARISEEHKTFSAINRSFSLDGTVDRAFIYMDVYRVQLFLVGVVVLGLFALQRKK